MNGKDPTPGDKIAGRYSLVELVNAGPSASVFRAADLMNGGQNTAIKIVRGDTAADVLEEFYQREILSLQRLKHPHVVRLLDHGNDEMYGRWLAIEWIERGTLADGQWQVQFRESTQLLGLMHSVLSALSAAHLAGIIHRDLKPGNILFDASGTAKIADFNVSKLLGRVGSTQTVKHYFTLRWAAPEQRLGKPADERSDVFSFGCICADILTGQTEADSLALRKRLDLLQHVPGPLRHLLKRMLSEDIASRPTAAEALRDVDAIRDSVGPETVVTLRLLPSVVRSLEEFEGRESTIKDVLAQVKVDLGGRLTVEENTRRGTQGGTAYSLIGKRYAYLAVCPDDLGKVEDELKLVNILRIPAHERAQQRGSGITLPVTADVIHATVSARLGRGVRDFVDQFTIARTQAEAQRRGKHADLKQIEVWQSYLDLSRAIKDERAKLGLLKWARERGDGYIELEMQSLFASTEELIDSWVVHVAPGGHAIRLGLVQDVVKNRLTIRPHDDLQVSVEALTGGEVIRDTNQEERSLQRQAAALRALRERTDAEGNLIDLLAHPERVSAAARVQLAPITPDLDPSNLAVVEACAGTERLFVVQGPPGTGKTTMIAELIAQLLRRAPESRILLVSQSNIALDNALERLQRLDPELPAIRLGRPEKVSQEARHLMLSERSRLEAERLRARALEARTTVARLVGRSAEELEYLERELRESAERTGDRESARELAESVLGPSPHGTGTPMAERLAVAKSLLVNGDAFLASIMDLQAQWAERVRADDEVEELLLQTVRVIAGTCIGFVASKVVSDAVFDWVIVDEAGRANPTELLVPLVKGRRIVLVGDHKQLPPVLDEDIAERVAEQHAIPQERLRRSLFEHLFEAVPEGARARLTRQYRMHPVIGGLIEHVFYPEGLDHAVDAAARPLGQRLLGSPLRWLDTGEGRTAREGKVGTSVINPGEVSVICQELEALAPRVTKRETPISVGVLTGYQAQRDALEDSISPLRRDWPYLDVAVLTIDAAQGKEFDLVFYSAVRSNDQNRIGFLRDERRLNVALSRARHGLTIVGNLRALLAARGRFGVNWFSPIRAWFSQDPVGRPILERVP